MKLIRMTYSSTEVKPSVLLLHFFRLYGIYVSERLWDIDETPIQSTIGVLSQDISSAGVNMNIDSCEDMYDFELILVNSEIDLNRLQLYTSELRTILIVSDNVSSLIKSSDFTYITYLDGEYEQLLGELLCAMKRIGVDEDDCDALELGINVFIKNEIEKITLSTKYFFATGDENIFKEYITLYQNCLEDCFTILKEHFCTWEDKKLLPIKYAAVKLAFETNLYCVRNKRSYAYRNEELLDLCNSIIQVCGENVDIVKSMKLLEAQIVDDLLLDRNVAYDLYVDICEDYNAFAYLKKGQYWQNCAEDLQCAIRYYLKSVTIFPEYYRAWHRLGQCYMYLHQEKMALKAFSIVVNVLKLKLDTFTIRPMEIEHLFKAASCCAQIWFKVYDNFHLAIEMSNLAIRARDAIDTTHFLDLMCKQSQDKDKVCEIVKQELDVKKVYHDLIDLYDFIHDDEMKKQYEQKYIST